MGMKWDTFQDVTGISGEKEVEEFCILRIK